MLPSYQPPKWTPPAYLRPSLNQSTAAPEPPPGDGPIIDVTPTSVVYETVTPAKPSYDNVPILKHSRINLLDFLEHRIAPPIPPSFPDIEGMNWRFEPFAHKEDHEVRLYLYLSPEYVARSEYHGIEHQVWEEEPLVDEFTLARIHEAMQAEIQATNDPHLKAVLDLEHQADLEGLTDEKLGLTISDYRAFPFRRTFENRLKAIQGQQKLNKTMIELKSRLDKVRMNG